MPALVIVATTPSPYQAELFDAIAATGEFRLRVIYMVRGHSDRQWEVRELAHEHTFWTDGAQARSAAEQRLVEADLAVLAWYAEPAARRLMQMRAESGGPWVYWGERPGFRGWKWLGRMRRRIQLAPLHQRPIPIWGMGAWAVRGWQDEFGRQRPYYNVPYFSDLERFAPGGKAVRPKGERRVLFSGSLIARKGVDLLADAFAAVATGRPQLRLAIVGGGPLEPMLRHKLAACAGQVQFLGFRQWRDLPGAYHEADILVAPSRYDGWGLIVPEGLAAGLPVIATNQMGAALELVRAGVNGWLLGAGERAALEQALAESADLPDETLEKMSVAARASVANHSLGDGVRRFSAAARAALQNANACRELMAS